MIIINKNKSRSRKINNEVGLIGMVQTGPDPLTVGFGLLTYCNTI